MRLDQKIKVIFGGISVEWKNILKTAAGIEWSEWQKLEYEALALERVFEKKANDLLDLAEQSNTDIENIVRNAVAYAEPDRLPVVWLVLTKMLHEECLPGKAGDWLSHLPKPGTITTFLGYFIKGEFRPNQKVFAELLNVVPYGHAQDTCITNLLFSRGRPPESASDLFSTLMRFSSVRQVDETDLFSLLGKFYRRRKIQNDLSLDQFTKLPKKWRVHILDHKKRSNKYLSPKLLRQLSKKPYTLEDSLASRRALEIFKKLRFQLQENHIAVSTLQTIASAPAPLETLGKRFNWASVKSISVPTCETAAVKDIGVNLKQLKKLLPSEPAANIALLILIWLSHHKAHKMPYKTPDDLKIYLVSASREMQEFCIRACRGKLQRDIAEITRKSRIPKLGIRAISDQVLAGRIDLNTDVNLLLKALDNASEKRQRAAYAQAFEDPAIGLSLLENSETFRSRYLSKIKRGTPPSYCATPEAFQTYGVLEDIGGEFIEALLSKAKNLRPVIKPQELLQKTILDAPACAPSIFGARGIAARKFVQLISGQKFQVLPSRLKTAIFDLQTPRGKNAFNDALKRRLVSEKLLKKLEGEPAFRPFLVRYSPWRLTKKRATTAEILSALVYMPSEVAHISEDYSAGQLRKALPKALELLEGRTRVAAALQLAVLSDISSLPIFLQLVQRLAPPFKTKQLGKRFDDLYTTYELPKKSGGNRIISAPAPHLKKAQRALLNLIYREKLSGAALGFRPGKSIRDNASLHVGQPIVVNADIQNFFPSTSYKKVYGLSRRLANEGLSPMAARLFSEICCHDGHLATGAPTSPAVSNLILKPLDDALIKTSKKLNVTYSRYADDLTFSGDSAAVWMLKPVRTHLKRLDYKLDPKKTNIFRSGRRQTVTGAVVNVKVNLARPLRKKLRAAVHRRVNGKEPHMHGKPLNDAALKGHLSYLSMLSPKHAKPLLKQLEALDNWKC